MKQIIKYFILLIFIGSCSSQTAIIDSNIYIKSSTTKDKPNKSEWKQWQHLDVVEDSLVGVSLNKAYNLMSNKKVDTTIIAVLDTRLIDGNKDLEKVLWTNKDEIPNNNIDDDGNGYVDDIHGWNFLGNRSGDQEYDASFEFVRIIKKYDKQFKGKNREDIKEKNLFDIYTRAEKTFKEEKEIIHANLDYIDSQKKEKNLAILQIEKAFPNESLKNENLDSLLKLTKDSLIIDKINVLKSYYENEDWLLGREKREKKHLDIFLNLDYNERSIVNDDPSNILDNSYGNQNVFSDSISPKLTHSIKVAGVLGANRNNDIGIKGVTNSSKIMLVAVAPSGDEHDKDIALGIRYAVDNGAKIINITFTKYFSLYPVWVSEAIRYAEKNDVLIVCSAGNYAKNMDNEVYYPNDSDINNNEYVENLIMVGSSTPFASKYLASDYSNYGKESVDIFAPGEFIYAPKSKGKYDFVSGTSYSAPIVSGIAGLIRSYYPNFTAIEIKQIILESGVTYDIMVNKPTMERKKELVPFSSLSKTGKIVNAYNALLMAEEVSKKKKRK